MFVLAKRSRLKILRFALLSFIADMFSMCLQLRGIDRDLVADKRALAAKQANTQGPRAHMYTPTSISASVADGGVFDGEETEADTQHTQYTMRTVGDIRSDSMLSHSGSDLHAYAHAHAPGPRFDRYEHEHEQDDVDERAVAAGDIRSDSILSAHAAAQSRAFDKRKPP